VIGGLALRQLLDRTVSLPLPAGVNEYLGCLKLSGSFADGDSNNMKAKGTHIVAGGTVAQLFYLFTTPLA